MMADENNTSEEVVAVVSLRIGRGELENVAVVALVDDLEKVVPQASIEAGHDLDGVSVERRRREVLAHGPGSALSNTGSPSMTAASVNRSAALILLEREAHVRIS